MALNTSVNTKFRYAFEQKCFRLIIEAYQESLIEGVIKINWNENDISSEIHKHILKNPKRLKWKVTSNVEAVIRRDIPMAKGFANKFPRIDFRFAACFSKQEYEYFFEAKNLKQNDSALKRRYIKTGIDSFVTYKYPQGSLIGYILEGGVEQTVSGINSLLIRDKRNTEVLCSCTSRLLRTFYESNHSNTYVLKHLFFDFT